MVVATTKQKSTRQTVGHLRILQLTSSRFFGGPERQMLELAAEMAPDHDTHFASFSEGGRCGSFLQRARTAGFDCSALMHDTPHLLAALRELAELLCSVRPDVLMCHGYKADLLGRRAARRCGIPVVGVSRGWTAESLRVRLYEALDRRCLGKLDHVVCVSEGQAAKVRKAGVRSERISVIPNAVRTVRFDDPEPGFREELLGWFDRPPKQIVGAAGRLSPEKGFDLLVEAAAIVSAQMPDVGFVLFGDGPRRNDLQRLISHNHLSSAFVMAGFRDDLDKFLPQLDWFALPSHTEGMPNVVLEAFAARVPVVATAVGGTPELIEDGKNGFLVPPGDARVLAERLLHALACPQRRNAMGSHGQMRVSERFTFTTQRDAYERLFQRLLAPPHAGAHCVTTC